MTWNERLNQRRKELDLTWTEIARMTGINIDNIYKYKNSGVEHPRGQNIKKLATALKVTEAWLLHGIEESPNSPQATPIQVPGPESMSKDLPVLGTAAGSLGEGAFQLTSDEVDFVRRPPAVAGVEGAYAVYVVGDSMEPVYHERDLCIVHPGRPVSIGDRVIIQLQNHEADGVQAYIKELVRRTSEAIICKQYNPPATIEFRTKVVKSVHKVLDMNDLFGV